MKSSRWMDVKLLLLILTTSILLILNFSTGEAVSKTSEREYAAHSFSPPFKLHRGNKRQVAERWTCNGSCSVKENFARLTSDIPSQVGWMFDTTPVTMDEFSLLLRFRVSGQGKTLFGDGFALWLTKQDSKVKTFKTGGILGGVEKFYGIGILFSTYRNTADRTIVHKDVSLVQSDGSKNSLDFIKKNRHGCVAKFRYHEGRDSFSVEDDSAVKVTLSKNKLSVLIDQNGNNNWIKCIEADLGQGDFEQPSLKDGWQKSDNMFFAISASTGALADNHDILEFMLTAPDRLESKLEARKVENEKPLISLDILKDDNSMEKVTNEVINLAEALKTLQGDNKRLQHSLEHKLENVDASLRSMIESLQKQETDVEGRLQKLQRKMELVERKIGKVENIDAGDIEMKITEKVGWSWTSIFFITLILLLLLVLVLWNVYTVQKLHRRDKIV